MDCIEVWLGFGVEGKTIQQKTIQH